MVLYFYLPGSVLVKIESQWYRNETHCDKGPGNQLNFFLLQHGFNFKKGISNNDELCRAIPK